MNNINQKMQSFIKVRGASEHNLKNIDIDIPKKQLVVLTGLSGSGKSSLAFDIIYKESFRRFSQAMHMPYYLMGSKSHMLSKRPNVKAVFGLPPALGLTQMQGVAGKLSTVGTLLGASDLLRVYFAAFGEVHCRSCLISLKPMTTKDMISKLFDTKQNTICKVISPIVEKRKGSFRESIEKLRIQGYSKLRINDKEVRIDEENVNLDGKKLNSIAVIIDSVKIEESKKYRLERSLNEALRLSGGIVRIETTDNQVISFNSNSSCPICGEWAPKLDPRYFSHSSLGQCQQCFGTGSSDPESTADLNPCSSCHGSRLDGKLPYVSILESGYANLHLKPIRDILTWVLKAKENARGDKAKEKIIFELERLVKTVLELGLGHLNLGREGWSLSPGDLQRIRLASIISNSLKGALYVLDEPCQGLTSQEVDSLVQIVKKIVSSSASIIAVEHHPHFIKSADFTIEMGPGAGIDGGQIISTFHSPKGESKTISPTQKTKKSKSNDDSFYVEFDSFKMRDIKYNKTKILYNKINLIRGPSGSGKTTFIDYKVMPLLRNCVEKKPFNLNEGITIFGEVKIETIIDAKPASITRSSRRSVASIVEALPILRKIFSQLPISQKLGLTESHFSFQSKLGRCDHCDGKGYLELQNKYGPPIEIICENCNGAKLNYRSLIPRFKGLNFSEVLNLQINQLVDHFKSFTRISSKLKKIIEFGLGYISLGQTLNTLSGGELQRLILISHMSRNTLIGNWFLLWHPGTGLHTPDINMLCKIMKIMVDDGATFVLVENREEFAEHSDNIINF